MMFAANAKPWLIPAMICNSGWAFSQCNKSTKTLTSIVRIANADNCLCWKLGNENQQRRPGFILTISTHSCPTDAALPSVRFKWISYTLTQAENCGQNPRQARFTHAREDTDQRQWRHKRAATGSVEVTECGYRIHTTTMLTNREVKLVGPPQTIEQWDNEIHKKKVRSPV